MNGNVYHVYDLFVLLSFGVDVVSLGQGDGSPCGRGINIRGRMRGGNKVLTARRARGQGLHFEIREPER